MKTITRKYKVYTYDELSKEAKEKVMQNFGISDTDITTDMLKEDFNYYIEENNPYFKNADFIWSLGNSQGDGLSFSCDIDLEGFIKAELPKLKHKKALYELVYSVSSKGNNGHYCYASKNDIDFEYNYTDKNLPKLEKLFEEEVLPAIQNKYLDVCNELKKMGYKEYEYISSNEYARETSGANEYTYLKDGTMFNE